MRQRQKVLFVVFFVLASIASAAAITCANRDVLVMLNAGISEGMITNWINARKVCQFDVSVEALIAFKQAGATQKLLDLIVEKSGVGAMTSDESVAQSFPLPKIFGVVHWVDERANWIMPLEEQDEKLKIGGLMSRHPKEIRQRWVEGAASGIRIQAGKGQTFVVRMQNSWRPRISELTEWAWANVGELHFLMRLTPNNGKRHLQIHRDRIPPFDLIRYHTVELAPSVYKYTVPKVLAPGEYCFTLQGDRAYYCFGVDETVAVHSSP